jgi:hypothetical protein
MFKEKVTHAFKEMRRIKVCCNFLIMKPEGIKKTISNDSTLSFNSEYTI